MGKGKVLNVATALLLSLLLVAIPLVRAQEPIYKAGDWIAYRISIKGSYMGQTIDCVVSARVSIVDVEYDEVTYKVEDIKVEKGGNECLQYSRDYVREYETISIRNKEPESGQIFIDPSYTGEREYQLGMAKIKVSYYKGVLTKYTLNADYEIFGLKYEMRASIELVDTSISELKPKAAFPWIVLLMIVIPVAVVVTVVVVVLLRRKARAVGAAPAQPPAQQPLQAGASAGSTA